MKTQHTGNAHRPSKFVRFRREVKRLAQKHGKYSPQVQHLLRAHPGWANKVKGWETWEYMP